MIPVPRTTLPKRGRRRQDPTYRELSAVCFGVKSKAATSTTRNEISTHRVREREQETVGMGRERETDTEREDPLPSTEPVFDCSSPPGRSIACRSTGKTVQPDGLDSSSDPRLHTVRLWASYINSRHLGFLRPLHPHRQN